MGTSSDPNNKGNFGSSPLPGSPTMLDVHELAEIHALEVIHGLHLMSEEGLDL